MGLGQIGQILGPFMIMRGLSCDHVVFGHFFILFYFFGWVGDPLTPPPPATGLVGGWGGG